MRILLLIVFCLALLVLLLRYLNKEKEEDAPASPSDDKKADCSDQKCGVTCFCDDATLRRAVKTEPDYYDDEELDAFKGIEADKYSDEQVETFHEVLTTLRQEEIGDWLRSLELRGVQLPSSLKDEALMLMGAN